MVKNLPVMKETWVRFLGEEDPLEEEMVTHSSILARKISWKEERGGLQSVGSQRVRHNLETKQLLIIISVSFYMLAYFPHHLIIIKCLEFQKLNSKYNSPPVTQFEKKNFPGTI